MTKEEKAREIAGLNEALKSGPSAFVLAQSGLTVNQVSLLRKSVRATSSRYRMVKNRLALRALLGTPLETLSPHFKGPTAIAFGSGDPAPLAKALSDFMKNNQGLKMKAALVDGRVVGSEQIKSLAEMPPRPVLVARFMAVLNAPMSRLVRVLKGPHGKLVRAMDEIARKKQKEVGAEPAPESPPQS
jgi:large subunit ribosomal protein L10